MTLSVRVAALVCVLSVASCGGEKEPAEKPASPELQKLALATDPGTAIGVVAAMAAGPKDHVVVSGRIGAILAGMAAFKLVDTSLPFCGEVNKEDNCPSPWDYCCESPDTKVANMLQVEVRDGDGRPLATPALPGMRPVDLIKVTGKLQKDEHGIFVLLADGLFRVDRPQIRQHVKWPE